MQNSIFLFLNLLLAGRARTFIYEKINLGVVFVRTQFVETRTVYVISALKDGFSIVLF